MVKKDIINELTEIRGDNIGLRAYINVSFAVLQEKKVFLSTIKKDCIIEKCYDSLSGYDYTLVGKTTSTLELYNYFQKLKKMLPSMSYKIYVMGEEQLLK